MSCFPRLSVAEQRSTRRADAGQDEYPVRRKFQQSAIALTGKKRNLTRLMNELIS
jgi:hypothetical protein